MYMHNYNPIIQIYLHFSFGSRLLKSTATIALPVSCPNLIQRSCSVQVPQRLTNTYIIATPDSHCCLVLPRDVIRPFKKIEQVLSLMKDDNPFVSLDRGQNCRLATVDYLRLSFFAVLVFVFVLFLSDTHSAVHLFLLLCSLAW